MVWPKPWLPSTTAWVGLSRTMVGCCPARTLAVPEPLDVAGDADDAVAVVAGEVGGDEVVCDAGGFGRLAAGGLEDRGHEGAEGVDGNIDCRGGHQAAPAMARAVAR